jgi:nitroreductase
MRQLPKLVRVGRTYLDTALHSPLRQPSRFHYGAAGGASNLWIQIKPSLALCIAKSSHDFFLATAELPTHHLGISDASIARCALVNLFPRNKGVNAMDVSEAIQKRVTIRRWKQRPVEKEKIVRVLEAGRRAPSWGNTQPWRFVVVQDRTKIEALAKAAGGQPQIATAPAAIVCCGVAEAFSKKMHREALKQLIEAGVMDWPDEVLDNIVLGSDVFAPYLLGEQVMTIKASEQVMISIAFMTLEALNQGLGSCWAGAISPKDVHAALNLPEGWFVHDFLLLGYPDEEPKPRPRKAFSEIVFWEKAS